MALSDKNILITPNIGQNSDPKIVFSGADVSSGPQNITMQVYPSSNGTLLFEGSAGQLFSITNSLTGTIYSVNDVSGMPSIEVLHTGLIKLAQYSGNILVGTGTDNGTDKLQVNGAVLATTFKGAVTGNVTGNATTATTLQTARTIGGVSFDGSANINLPGVNTAGNQNTTGSAATLTTARTINGVSFDGSANITVTATATNALTIGTGLSGTSYNGSSAVTVALASGYGDTLNPYASKTANYVLAAPNGAAGVPTFRAIVAADIPTLNQNTTGTASNVTGTVAIANGGSGQITAQLAMNAFAGAVTSGSYLRGNGTNVVMSAIQAADVPTLNQNTTGSAATLTTARTINGVSFNGSANITVTATATNALTIGTGLSGTSYNGSGAVTVALASGYGDTLNPYASKTANNFLAAPNGAAGVPTFRALVAADIPTLNQNTTGSAATLTTARTINGVSFNGSVDITVGDATKLPLGGGTLTGTLVLSTATGTDATGDAGALTLRGGNSSSAGVGGNLLINGGDTVSTTAAKNGGRVDIRGGNNTSVSGGSGALLELNGGAAVVGTGGQARLYSGASKGTNIVGSDLMLFTGLGTGTGVGGTMRFYTSGPTTAGTGLQSHTSRLEIDNTGRVAMLVNIASSSTTTGTLVVTGGVGVSGTVYAGGFNGPLTGNASTATNVAYSGLTGTVPTWNQNTTGSAATLTTARTINGVSFDGSANITVADSTKLPLAGGTMTGAITFAAGQTWPTFNQNTTGSAATLTTARTINGVSFNGSADITITAANPNALTIGTGLSGTSYNGSGAVTIAIDSTVATLTGSQTLTNKTLTFPIIDNIRMGHTSTATAAGTTVLTATSTYQQRFTGTTTQTITLPVTSTLAIGVTYSIENTSTGNLTVNSSGGNLVATVIPGTTIDCTCIGITLTTAADWDPEYRAFASITGTGSVVMSTSPTLVTPALGTPSSGNLANCTFPTLNQNTTGSAATLTTARTINGTSFNGSANITTANWGTARTLWGQSVDGSANITSPLLPAAGTAALPAFSTSGDTNTGMYFSAADTIGFAAGGVIGFSVGTAASAVNYLEARGAATANSPRIVALGSDTNVPITFVTKGTGEIRFTTNSAERMRIDGSGNVSIGTTTTVSGFHVAAPIGTPSGNGVFSGTDGGYGAIQLNGSTGGFIDFSTSGTDFKGRILYGHTSNIMTFYANGIDRGSINDKWTLLSAQAGGYNNRTLNLDGPSISSPGIGFHAPINSNAGIIIYEGSQGGFYFVNSTNSGFVPIWASAFNIGSDYRLKTDIVDLQSGLQDIMNLSPKKYTLFDGDKESRGFIAHEVSPHIPEAVGGEFDAEDERGFPVYQTLDPAAILATTVAAIQELKVLIDQQAIEIQQLKEKLNA